MIEGMSPGRPPGPARRVTTVVMAAAVLGCTVPNPAFLRTRPDADLDDQTGGALVVDAARAADTRRVAADVGLRATPDLEPAPPDLAASVPDLAPAPDLAPDAARGPRSLVLANGGGTGAHGGTGGVARSGACPGDQVLIGYRGSLGNDNGGSQVLYSLAASCGELVVTGGNPYSVTVVARGTLPEVGGSGTTRFTSLCPANQVIVGFSGRAGTFLDRLQLQCAPLSITGTATLSVLVGAPTALTRYGGTGGTAFQDACPAGHVARGHSINEGSLIDSLAFTCAAPTVVE
jgi:hypothetical protein